MSALLFTLLMVWLVACGGSRSERAVMDAASTSHSSAFQLSPGDLVEIKFPYHHEYDAELWIRPDGRIDLQEVGEIKAAGMTPAELDSTLEQLYDRILIEPEITVSSKSSPRLKVFVGGEVESPKLVPMEGGLSLLGAIFEAGGFKPSAKVSEVLVLRQSSQSGYSTLRLDLRPALRGEDSRSNLELQPFDVVIVPKSGIAKANQFVDEYIDGLVPLGALSGFGWIYLIGRDAF